MNSRTLCLGILSFGETTGYDINKMASEGDFSHFVEASYGSIYPALTRLTKEDLVTWREEQSPGNPPRKIYAITDAGRAEFARALTEPPKGDVFKSEFLFLNLFTDILTVEQLQKLRSDRIAALEHELDRLNDVASNCDHKGSQFAIGYGIALTTAAIAYLKGALADHENPTSSLSVMAAE